MPHHSLRNPDPHVRPSPREIAKSTLSPARQQLVELVQETWYGRVEDLLVRDGEPLLDPLPPVYQDIKLDSDDDPPPHLSGGDFVLKSQVVKLLASLDRIRNGTIAMLEIRHGLPFRIVVRRAVA